MGSPIADPDNNDSTQATGSLTDTVRMTGLTPAFSQASQRC
jgi:hypothetical protein